MADQPQSGGAGSAGAPAAGSAASISSDELFAGRQELVIVHDGQRYRLRITRLGKLILTK